MVTSQRPAWEPRAINTDLESQADTQLAAGLLDYYMREKHLELAMNSATELSLFLKEGWVSMDWNVTGGEVHGINPESGQPIYEGDVAFGVHNIMDVARDVYRRDMKHDWFVLRTFANKYDLAAKYPDMASKIIELSDDKASPGVYYYVIYAKGVDGYEYNLYGVFHLMREE
jgi:hypothetical protein